MGGHQDHRRSLPTDVNNEYYYYYKQRRCISLSSMRIQHFVYGLVSRGNRHTLAGLMSIPLWCSMVAIAKIHYFAQPSVLGVSIVEFKKINTHFLFSLFLFF